jgi:hypothetical protein
VAGPVVNEFSPRPAGSEGEWIEIALGDEAPLSLEGWSIRDATGKPRRLPGPSSLFPGGVLLLAARPESLRAHYALPDSIHVVDPETWPILNDHDAESGLPADVIVLVDAAGIVRDSVAYFESWLSPDPGRSLERVRLTAPAELASSWGWSVDPEGATPGRPNSLARDLSEPDRTWTGPSRVILRRGAATFRYRLPGAGRLGIWLLDLEGHEVAVLQEPRDLPAAGLWVWGPGVPAPPRPGLYFLCLRWEGAGRGLRRCRSVWVER